MTLFCDRMDFIWHQTDSTKKSSFQNWQSALPIRLLGLICFMGWLTLLFILQGFQYYEQIQFANTHPAEKEETEEDDEVGHLIIDDSIPIIEEDKLTQCAGTSSTSSIINENKTEEEKHACVLKDQLIKEFIRRDLPANSNSIYETGKKLSEIFCFFV